MAGMALDPMPVDAMPLGGVEQPLPQLGILDRLPGGRPPSIPAPAMYPLGDAVADIDPVGGEDDVAGPLQRFQAPDRSKELHAIVGLQWLHARQLLLIGARSVDGAPHPTARRSLASALGTHIHTQHFRN